MFNYYFEYLCSIECENENRILNGYEAVEALPKHEAIKRGFVRKPEFKVFSQEEYAKRKWF
ncbi:MAG: hypothetical protein MR695_05865 [Solobacterium sp.]|nr:hypothetical protein [Solobacterium sp.]